MFFTSYYDLPGAHWKPKTFEPWKYGLNKTSRFSSVRRRHFYPRRVSQTE